MPYLPTIPTAVLFCLASLACPVQAQTPAQAPAQAAAPAPAPPERTMAENQLEVATIKVRLMKQIAASIEQEVDMLNQKFKLVGNYYKDFSTAGTFLVRLQLKLEGLGDTGSTLLQVSDGKVLWDFQKVLKMQDYRKKEILPIMQKLDSSNLDPFSRSLVTSQLGFGGPEAMLTGLSKAVKFETVESKVVDGVEVWDLGGTWVDRSKLLGMDGRQLPPNAPLPPYVPSKIHVFVGKENGWPYKIVMQGVQPTKVPEDTRAVDPVSGRPVGVKRDPPKVDPSQITLYYKLLPLTELNASLFKFSPPADIPTSSVKDETEEFLAQLDLYIQGMANQKKNEAAKAAEEPTLNANPLTPKDLGAPDTFPTTPANPTPPTKAPTPK